jgi:hypothetical protein
MHFRYSFTHTGRERKRSIRVTGGGSEVCLLLCDGSDGAVALELGLTVINHHRPWACPKLAPHFQISTGDCQLPEFLHGWKGEGGYVRGAARAEGLASAPSIAQVDISVL